MSVRVKEEEGIAREYLDYPRYFVPLKAFINQYIIYFRSFILRKTDSTSCWLVLQPSWRGHRTRVSVKQHLFTVTTQNRINQTHRIARHLSHDSYFLIIFINTTRCSFSHCKCHCQWCIIVLISRLETGSDFVSFVGFTVSDVVNKVESTKDNHAMVVHGLVASEILGIWCVVSMIRGDRDWTKELYEFVQWDANVVTWFEVEIYVRCFDISVDSTWVQIAFLFGMSRTVPLKLSGPGLVSVTPVQMYSSNDRSLITQRYLLDERKIMREPVMLIH